MSNKKKLLVVDDIDLNRLILAELFSEQYDVLEAENGQQALGFVVAYGDDIAVVLLDLIMPVMDGFMVLQAMQKSGIINTVPVILITGENDDEMAIRCYALGASDLVKKPFNPEIVVRRVNNVAALYAHRQEQEQKLREQKEMLEKQGDRLRQANQFVIDALSAAVEFRDSESGEHIKRIRLLTKTILQAVRGQYPLSDEAIEIIAGAAAMHDIGKIAIPDAILLKPGPLTEAEFEVMKTHALRGCEILQSLNYTQDPEYYTYCYDICRHHHERWDGKGYPDGLKGDETPIWAQATSLADVYDALTSRRVYKDACSHDEAVRMIMDGECGAFNPGMLRRFEQVQNDLLAQAQANRRTGQRAKPREYKREEAAHV